MNFRHLFRKAVWLLCCGFCFTASAAQDTIVNSRHPSSFYLRQFTVPVLLAGAGLSLSGSPRYEVQRWRDKHFDGFRTNADDVLSLAPIAVVYGLDILGVQARTDLINRSVILLKAELLALGSVYLLKSTTRELRPDGSDVHSFPSNHSTQAFLAASFLSEEYGRRIRWIPYVAYTAASSVSVLRVLNNKHYISDVLVGAGIGILSQKLAYLTHRYKWGKRKPQTPLDF